MDPSATSPSRCRLEPHAARASSAEALKYLELGPTKSAHHSAGQPRPRRPPRTRTRWRPESPKTLEKLSERPSVNPGPRACSVCARGSRVQRANHSRAWKSRSSETSPTTHYRGIQGREHAAKSTEAAPTLALSCSRSPGRYFWVWSSKHKNALFSSSRPSRSPRLPVISPARAARRCPESNWIAQSRTWRRSPAGLPGRAYNQSACDTKSERPGWEGPGRSHIPRTPRRSHTTYPKRKLGDRN